jgi:hypothetical protein
MKRHVASGIIPGFVFLCLTVAGACSRNLSGPVERSEWGGEHVGLTVSANGGALEYDCASGTIDQSIVVATNGNFTVQGTHSPGHGGPIREGELAERHPAQYEGWTDGDTMRFSVTLTDTGQKLGPFNLVRGQSPHVFRCL